MISYLITVVLSAFLLFLIQPFIGKVILPWFGGSAGVWSAVLLFFQFILLLGYGYSFVLTTYLDQRKQKITHIVVAGISLIPLLIGMLNGVPLLPSPQLKPAVETLPVPRILLILVSTVGIPYFTLSTTGPLLQSWYTRVVKDRTPYWLYALSNAGSFSALLMYPFVIEPMMTIKSQAWMWSLAYIVFAVSVGYIIFRVWQHKEMPNGLTTTASAKPEKKEKGLPASKKGKQVKSNQRDSASGQSIGKFWKKRGLTAEEREYMQRIGTAAQWLVLAMCATILLAAVTNQITQYVAPIPLLWILPLGLYLVTFVISFSVKAAYLRLSIPLLGFATLAVVFALAQGNNLSVLIQIGIYAAALFFACLACHSELARLKPDLQLLTAYYLIIALGGVMGTVFVSLIAPVIFDYYWELHLGFLLCWVIIIAVLYFDRNSILHQKMRNVVLYVLLIPPVTLFLFTGQYYGVFRSTTILANRNFYGTLRLQEQSTLAGWEPFYILSHGTTIHGMQYKPSPIRKEPIAYFTVSSGVGRLLTEVNRGQTGKRVGVLGLGVGTLAAYGREQDVYRFYEINPEVVNLAEGRDGYFNYLSNASADIDVILGDARLSLESELEESGGQGYDVLVLDVFSGDAPPVHLLTEECFALYLDHLSPNGVIAANISTTHINLKPLLAGMAERYDMHAVLIEDNAEGYPCCQSRWVLMSSTTDILSSPDIAEFSQQLEKPPTDLRLWTDDYSTLLQVLN